MTSVNIINITAIIGVFITLFTFLKGIIEYRKQGALKSAEYFITIRRKFKEDKVFQNICKLLEYNDKEIMNVSSSDKNYFLGFFEEIALMMNSKIIKENIVFYMFGYYVNKCWECDYFWDNKVNKEDPNWRLFKEFALTMQKYQKILSNKIKVTNLKF